MKSEHKQKFLDADEVERKRCKDLGAYRRVLRSKIQKSGKPINHLLRVLRVKPTEVRVRWAYDQKRAREIDDYETYASVLREETSRLMDIRACHKGYKTLHGDWVSAFLHCDSTEPFYTDYPSDDPEAEDGKYCMEWVKWLYGKAPASKALRDDARDMLLSLGFVEQENSDPCVYIHEERDLQFGLYVDDQKINGPDDQLQWLAHRVSERFESKWLGLTDIDHDFATEESQHFVGSRTICDPVNKILTYDQKRLIQQGLQKFGVENCRQRHTPSDATDLKQHRPEGKVDPKFQSLYRSKVGFLIHIAFKSRPDLMQASVKAARENGYPSPQAMHYVDQILRYLSTTADQCLTYHCSLPLHETAVASCDSAFSDQDGAKSTTGWCIMVAGAAAFWGSGTTSGLSSTEVEHKGGMDVCKSILYVKRLFTSLRLKFPVPCPLMVDNMGHIALVCAPAAPHQRTKHIDTKYHFQRTLVKDGVVRYQHQDTNHQFTDIFTKDLAKVLHERHKNVIPGLAQMQVVTKKLPESKAAYAKMHNEVLASKEKQDAMQRAYASLQKISKPTLLALIAILEDEKKV